MSPTGFQPTIPASEQPQTALDRAATGIGKTKVYETIIRITLFCAREIMDSVQEDGSGLWSLWTENT